MTSPADGSCIAAAARDDRGGGVGVPKWNRIGVASAFVASPAGSGDKVGWTWEIRRPGFEPATYVSRSR